MTIDDFAHLDRVYTDGAVEWAKRRAGKRSISETESRMDYAPIVFPSPEALRHAALVVCSRMVNEPDPAAAAREVLLALALPTIMRNGGDGRTVRGRGRPHAGTVRREPYPIGYDPEDYGRPDARESRKKKKVNSAEVLSERL